MGPANEVVATIRIAKLGFTLHLYPFISPTTKPITHRTLHVSYKITSLYAFKNRDAMVEPSETRFHHSFLTVYLVRFEIELALNSANALMYVDIILI